MGPGQRHRRADGESPGEEADAQDPQRVGAARPLVVQCVFGDQRWGAGVRSAVPLGGTHGAWEPATKRQADARRGRDDHGERHREYGEREERRHRQSGERRVAQRPTPDTENGVGHDGQHRGCQAGEEGSEQERVTGRDVGRRQRQQGHHAGQDEQCARHQTTAHTVDEPADVDGQLLGFGAGQQRAVREGVEESALTDPALLVNEDALHDPDLSGGAPEGLQRDGEPDSRAGGTG